MQRVVSICKQSDGPVEALSTAIPYKRATRRNGRAPNCGSQHLGFEADVLLNSRHIYCGQMCRVRADDMKGLVFAEFLEMVEKSHSPEMVDDIIENAAPGSGGAYTAVGTYPHQEMIDLASALSEQTGTPLPDLMRTFGRHLMGRFVMLYPEFFDGVSNTFAFLETLEDHIHREVLKLYPEAELPRFSYMHPTDDTMVLHYRSARPFADFAEGLLHGCIEYWRETIQLTREDLDGPPGTNARFTLTRQ